MKIYLTNITPLLEADCFQRALSLADKQRAEKVKKIKVRAEQARSLGAGLLLQYGLMESVGEKTANQKIAVRLPGVKTENSEKQTLIAEVSVPEILNRLSEQNAQDGQNVQKIKVDYGDNGKPYLVGKEHAGIYFNLSHSKDYAVCALGEEELGIDLQFQREDIRKGLPEQLFTAKENALLKQCAGKEEYKSLFYFFFSAKEATVKLTGRGMKQEFKKLEVVPKLKTVFDAETKEGIACLEAFSYLQDYSLVTARKYPEPHILI